MEGGGDFWYYGKPHAWFRQNGRLGVASQNRKETSLLFAIIEKIPLAVAIILLLTFSAVDCGSPDGECYGVNPFYPRCCLASLPSFSLVGEP
jgi:hypothetical protein